MNMINKGLKTALVSFLPDAKTVLKACKFNRKNGCRFAMATMGSDIACGRYTHYHSKLNRLADRGMTRSTGKNCLGRLQIILDNIGELKGNKMKHTDPGGFVHNGILEEIFLGEDRETLIIKGFGLRDQAIKLDELSVAVSDRFNNISFTVLGKAHLVGTTEVFFKPVPEDAK